MQITSGDFRWRYVHKGNPLASLVVTEASNFVHISKGRRVGTTPREEDMSCRLYNVERSVKIVARICSLDCGFNYSVQDYFPPAEVSAVDRFSLR
ncbi:hypothetical protein GOP47_0018695 [Adiantum capillus-veneris]|uniref:Uncharacterized protein n=1 Tax=Adiantum capillus-veneris TaxID=13818 RepID=A0A9D4ZAZ1_ADICA|nr:hypothetical protein GOP47_0018695 [Adiantum capillus-veneris]